MTVFLILALLGTAAFAVSGAMVGIGKHMDIFGVSMLGVITAVGGGVLRDLVLNITPPAAFQQPVFALTALAVSLLIFVPGVRRQLRKTKRFGDPLLLIMDSIGLGIFTVVGVQTVLGASGDVNRFLAIFVGVVTGVGGGVLRDVLAGDTPYVFVKHFYACASLVGGLVCTLSWPLLGQLPSMLSGMAVTLILRLLAAHFHWSLPKAC